MQEDLHTATEKISLKEAFVNLTDTARDVADTYVKLGMARVTRKAADVAAGLVSAVVLALVSLLAVIFGFIGLAVWVGNLINSLAGGFGIVAGFFVLLAVLIISLKSSVISPMIRNMVVKKVYENDDDDDNNV